MTFICKGKPETPKEIIISDITASSFKIQFSPSFDGGSGSQEFLIQVTDLWNSSMMDRVVPFNTYEYSITGKMILCLISEISEQYSQIYYE